MSWWVSGEVLSLASSSLVIVRLYYRALPWTADVLWVKRWSSKINPITSPSLYPIIICHMIRVISPTPTKTRLVRLCNAFPKQPRFQTLFFHPKGHLPKRRSKNIWPFRLPYVATLRKTKDHAAIFKLSAKGEATLHVSKPSNSRTSGTVYPLLRKTSVSRSGAIWLWNKKSDCEARVNLLWSSLTPKLNCLYTRRLAESETCPQTRQFSFFAGNHIMEHWVAFLLVKYPLLPLPPPHLEYTHLSTISTCDECL